MNNIQVNHDVVSNTGSTEYGALFTGEALLTPVSVNPNRDELIKIKGLENIEDRVQEPQYTNIDLNGSSFTKADFFFTFNPNEMLGLDNSKYEDSLIVNYPVFVSSDPSTNKDGTKMEIIDQHNQSAWIPIIEGASVAEALDKHIKDLESMNASEYYINRLKSIDPNSARQALRGETMLYQVIFELTVLPPHNVKKVKDKEGNTVPYPLNNFVLGGNIDPEKATAEMKKVVAGDVSYIRDVMNNDICKHKDGSTSRVWGMLGVNPAGGDKFYQELFRDPYTCCLRSDTSSTRTYGKWTTNLSKDANAKLTSDEYPWKCYWGGSLDFKKFDKAKYQAPSNSVSDDSAIPGGSDDDLPF